MSVCCAAVLTLILPGAHLVCLPPLCGMIFLIHTLRMYATTPLSNLSSSHQQRVMPQHIAVEILYAWQSNTLIRVLFPRSVRTGHSDAGYARR
jgi:hypothetical protein